MPSFAVKVKRGRSDMIEIRSTFDAVKRKGDKLTERRKEVIKLSIQKAKIDFDSIILSGYAKF